MAIRWTYRAEMINACNCDWGCPCNFNAKPTYGHCHGVYAAHITDGVCGDTRLSGLKYAVAGSWPGAIHEGRGIGKLWIDESAVPAQREALEGIVRGKFGGMPWMILSATIDTWLDTAYVPFEWKFDGAHSSYKAGSEAHAILEPMRNPVSGQEASARVLLPAGIVTKELDVTSTHSFSVFTNGLKFAEPGKYGFYTVVQHSN
jgi:hypothetical protein